MAHRDGSRSSGPRLLGFVALLGVLSASPVARGSGQDDAAAEALFMAAKELMAKGDYAAACPKLADSQRLDPGVGTLLNLALCYEKNGQTASAWSTFREAAAAARDKGQTEREANARQEAQRLEPLLLKVIVSVAAAPDGGEVQVKIDTISLPSGLWGMPTPLDPGTHQLTATGPGKKPWVTTFEVKQGPTETIAVPVLELAPVEAPAPAPITEPSPLPPETSPGPDRPNDGRGQRMAGLIVGGVGVGGLIAAGVFTGLASSNYSSSEVHCNGDHCTDTGAENRERAFDQALVATIAGTIGVVGVVGGAVLWFTAPRVAQEKPAAVSVTPMFGAGAAGIRVGGHL